jgi:hypothetical protein
LKIPILFLTYLIASLSVKCQVFSAINITEAGSLSKNKYDPYFTKKGFVFSGDYSKADTIVREYNFRGLGKKLKTDSIKRTAFVLTTKENDCLRYKTLSAKEFYKIRTELKADGFHCDQEVEVADSMIILPLIYQRNELVVTLSSKPMDTLTEFTFFVEKKSLPKPKEIVFAEDLLTFDSHETLRFYFGDQNVKKDIYFLSDTKVGKCSVLFPNTDRQVVFLWADEDNNRKLDKIYIGGQLMAESSLQYDKNIAENIWQLKSGVRQGMSLFELRQLNAAEFSFYGGKSNNTGLVLNDSQGKLNFKDENIILGCMNCRDSQFLKENIYNSDLAIQEERILFVHTIILKKEKS